MNQNHRMSHRLASISSVDMSMFTLWLFVFAVGIFGLLAGYQRTEFPDRYDGISEVRMIDIALHDDMFVSDEPKHADDNYDELELPRDIHVPDIPPAIGMGELPKIEELRKIIPAPVVKTEKKFSSVHLPPEVKVKPLAAPAPRVKQEKEVRDLRHGEGLGRQPDIVYPLRAVMKRMEGRVVVVFSVDEAGRVTDVEVEESSSWPILDEAVLKTIKNRWRFPAGVSGDFRISYRFELE